MSRNLNDPEKGTKESLETIEKEFKNLFKKGQRDPKKIKDFFSRADINTYLSDLNPETKKKWDELIQIGFETIVSNSGEEGMEDNSYEIIQFLLEHKAIKTHIDLNSKQGTPSFMLAVSAGLDGNQKIANFLLAQGADFWACDRANHSILTQNIYELCKPRDVEQGVRDHMHRALNYLLTKIDLEYDLRRPDNNDNTAISIVQRYKYKPLLEKFHAAIQAQEKAEKDALVSATQITITDAKLNLLQTLEHIKKQNILADSAKRIREEQVSQTLRNGSKEILDYAVTEAAKNFINLFLNNTFIEYTKNQKIPKKLILLGEDVYKEKSDNATSSIQLDHYNDSVIENALKKFFMDYINNIEIDAAGENLEKNISTLAKNFQEIAMKNFVNKFLLNSIFDGDIAKTKFVLDSQTLKPFVDINTYFKGIGSLFNGAVLFKHLEIARLLKSHNAKTNAAINLDYSLLTKAVEENNVVLAKQLIEDLKVNPHELDAKGRSAISIVQDKINRIMETPFDITLQNTYKEISQLLALLTTEKEQQERLINIANEQNVKQLQNIFLFNLYANNMQVVNFLLTNESTRAAIAQFISIEMAKLIQETFFVYLENDDMQTIIFLLTNPFTGPILAKDPDTILLLLRKKKFFEANKLIDQIAELNKQKVEISSEFLNALASDNGKDSMTIMRVLLSPLLFPNVNIDIYKMDNNGDSLFSIAKEKDNKQLLGFFKNYRLLNPEKEKAILDTLKEKRDIAVLKEKAISDKLTEERNLAALEEAQKQIRNKDAEAARLLILQKNKEKQINYRRQNYLKPIDMYIEALDTLIEKLTKKLGKKSLKTIIFGTDNTKNQQLNFTKRLKKDLEEIKTKLKTEEEIQAALKSVNSTIKNHKDKNQPNGLKETLTSISTDIQRIVTKEAKKASPNK